MCSTIDYHQRRHQRINVAPAVIQLFRKLWCEYFFKYLVFFVDVFNWLTFNKSNFFLNKAFVMSFVTAFWLWYDVLPSNKMQNYFKVFGFGYRNKFNSKTSQKVEQTQKYKMRGCQSRLSRLWKKINSLFTVCDWVLRKKHCSFPFRWE